MKTFPIPSLNKSSARNAHKPLRVFLAAWACAAAAGNAAAVPMAHTQEVDLFMFRVTDLQTSSASGDPLAFSSVAAVTPEMGYLPFYSYMGTLLSVRWEIDMVYSTRVHSALDSLSTNPAEMVSSGNVSAFMSAGTNVLAGTGGQQFAVTAETNNQCTTSLALGTCDWIDKTEMHLQSGIDATDLSVFLAGDVILQQLVLGATLGHAGGQGPYSLTSFAEFGAYGVGFGDGTLRLVYTYDDGTGNPGGTPVPEPGTLALTGLGLAGLLRRGAISGGKC